MSMKAEESSAEAEEHENALKGFKGVRRRKWGRWVSEIRVPKSRSRIWLGSYDSAEKAARAYDAAVYCLRGEAARFNFPVDEIRPQLTDEQRLSLSIAEVKEIANVYAYSLAAPSKVVNEDAEEETDGVVVGACSMDLPTSPVAPGAGLWDYSFESLLSGDAVMIEEVIDMWDLL